MNEADRPDRLDALEHALQQLRRGQAVSARVLEQLLDHLEDNEALSAAEATRLREALREAGA